MTLHYLYGVHYDWSGLKISVNQTQFISKQTYTQINKYKQINN